MAPNDINDDAKEIELPVGETVVDVAVVVLGAPDWLFVVVVDINFINNGPEEVTAVDEPPTLIFFLIFFSLSPLKTKKKRKLTAPFLRELRDKDIVAMLVVLTTNTKKKLLVMNTKYRIFQEMKEEGREMGEK